MRRAFVLAILLASLLSAGMADHPRLAVAAANTITAPDTGRFGDTSMVLDASGDPVVVYAKVGEVRLLHSNDPACAGGDDSVAVFPVAFPVDSSLVLDPAGNPVISVADYYTGLEVVHCDDPNCAGGDDSLTLQDAAAYLQYVYLTSIALDPSGNPLVVSKGYPTVSLLHCNDPSCTGSDETITDLDDNVINIATLGMELTSQGFPVIGYWNTLLRCADLDCQSRVYANLPAADPYHAFILDGADDPVVANYARLDGDLIVGRCTDHACSGVSMAAADIAKDVGAYPSLALDTSGNPVVSYLDVTRGRLKVLHCNDPACVGGDESPTELDIPGIGIGTSTMLDSAGFPIVAFYDWGHVRLEVLHCSNPDCSGPVEQEDPLEFVPSMRLAAQQGAVCAADVCRVPAGHQFRLTTTVVDPPAEGHIGLETRLDYTELKANGGAYLPAPLASEVKFAQCAYPGIAVRSPFDPLASNQTVVEHAMTSGVVDFATCHALGDVVSLNMVCSPNYSSSELFLTPYIGESPQGTGFKLPVSAGAVSVPANTEPVTIECVPPLAAPSDSDGDGCSDQQENGANPEEGGQRSLVSFWDFYDVWTHPFGNPAGWERDATVGLFGDIFGVAQRFGAQWPAPLAESQAAAAALSPPTSDIGYHADFDRSPALVGGSPWDMGPPDGVIDFFTDIFGVALQFGHAC